MNGDKEHDVVFDAEKMAYELVDSINTQLVGLALHAFREGYKKALRDHYRICEECATDASELQKAIIKDVES